MAAYKLMLKLQGEGISVPNQVSIISFDNTDLSQTVVPALTSMNISKHDFATEAVNLMLWRIKHTGEQSKNIYVKSRLIERDSISHLS
jgi:LacI family transcriptional regulator